MIRWIGFAVGVALVVLTAIGVIFTLVLPRARAAPQRLSMVINRVTLAVFVRIGSHSSRYETIDGRLAPVGPVVLILQLGIWLTCFFFGFALMQWPFTESFTHAMELSGSGLLTVGFATPAVGGESSTVTIIAAATGAIVIALQIAYLPAIYSAYSRRETLVTMLESRAGVPAWGPELLVRHRLAGITDTLPELYDEWEKWSAEVSESHTTYPVLVLFRSPEPWYSWVLSLLAVLDAAALHLSLNPETAPSEARLCLRMGFTAFRRIATSLDWEFDSDPLPDADISLTFAQFEHAVGLLQEAGFETELTAEQAWPHFKGWRVNYETLAYRLTDETVAPPAPWSGPRRHLKLEAVNPIRPPHRAPGGIEYSYRIDGRPDMEL
ncbi:MAG: hypothetical protein ABI570_02255 [Ilumatobacteraceae bacterium]